MDKILNLEQTIELSNKMRGEGKIIVLVGGCFDILHIGHVKFLEAAKKEGDILTVLLESDVSVSKIKGEQRPINDQKDRGLVLAALCTVDIVCMLPPLTTDREYEKLVSKIKPAIIAITKNDRHRKQKERQAKLVNAQVKIVTNRLLDKSTSRLLALLGER